MDKLFRIILLINTITLAIILPSNVFAEAKLTANNHVLKETNIEIIDTTKKHARFRFNSGLTFEYPDAVRGIYVTGHSAGGKRFEKLIDFINRTDLNSMVIDVKDDLGNITFPMDDESPYADIGTNYINNPEEMMKRLEEEEIYPIARIVVFKDTVLAEERPDLSFKENGQVWKNGRGEAFVNPFLKEIWEYNIEVAKMAAELGFKEIQFDYVRFAEGFELIDERVEYSQGDYAEYELENVQKRVEAVTDFVAYAREELAYYDVDVSVDIFGYAATIPETPGIGQNFSKIAENVDIISSMIYPSHWSEGYFDIPFPDKEPYKLVSEYMKVENEVLDALDEKPNSRPWLQDFSAPWLYTAPGSGPVTKYGKEEVEAQIRALYENGVREFLLWNSGNQYTENVNYLLQ